MTDPKAIGIVLPPRQVAAAITDFHGYFDQHGKAVAELPYAQIERVADELYRAYQEGRRVFLFGNGGSAALASHLACDLGKGTIVFGGWKLSFREVVPFVREIDEGIAIGILRLEATLMSLNLLNDCLGLFASVMA